jgi:transposase
MTLAKRSRAKRHFLVDTQGLLLLALVHSAGMQDHDGGILLMSPLFGGYQGAQFQKGLRRVCQSLNVEIVKRSDAAKKFVVLPKRWIVERSIAWLNRFRRLAKDWECLNKQVLGCLRLASIRLMVRKLRQEPK